MTHADVARFRRWCSRVARLVASGVPFRRAVRMADVAAELDAAMARAEIHPARASAGGRA